MFTASSEPVGAKAPTFSSDTKSWTFVRQTGDDFALLCAAQAFPVPLIRYDYVMSMCPRKSHPLATLSLYGDIQFHSMRYAHRAGWCQGTDIRQRNENMVVCEAAVRRFCVTMSGSSISSATDQVKYVKHNSCPLVPNISLNI